MEKILKAYSIHFDWGNYVEYEVRSMDIPRYKLFIMGGCTDEHSEKWTPMERWMD